MELQLALLQTGSRHTESQMRQISDLLDERKNILALPGDGVVLKEVVAP